jgi:hypothetical protein
MLICLLTNFMVAHHSHKRRKELLGGEWLGYKDTCAIGNGV